MVLANNAVIAVELATAIDQEVLFAIMAVIAVPSTKAAVEAALSAINAAIAEELFTVAVSSVTA